MAYRCKELHPDDTVKVVFLEFKDAVGRAERRRTTRAILRKHGDG